MSKRLVSVIGSSENNIAKIYRDYDDNEYVVKFYKNGTKHIPDADYYTDDLDDARGTANAGLAHMSKQTKARSNSIKPSRKGKTVKKARAIGQPSQRNHKDPKTGKLTKKPTERLMQRRKRDTIPGYYPNPAKRDTYKEKFRDELLNYAQRHINSDSAANASIQYRREHAAYIDGLLHAGVIAGIIYVKEHDDTMRHINKMWGLE